MGAFPVLARLVILLVAHSSFCNGYMIDVVQPEWFKSPEPSPASASEENSHILPSPHDTPGQPGTEHIKQLETEIQEYTSKYNEVLKKFSDSVIAARSQKEPLLKQLETLQGTLWKVEQQEHKAKDTLDSYQTDSRQKIKEAHDVSMDLKEKLYQCIDDNIAKNLMRWTTSVAPTEGPNSTEPLAGIAPGAVLPPDAGNEPVAAVRPAPAENPQHWREMPGGQKPTPVPEIKISTTDPTPVQGIRGNFEGIPRVVLTTPEPESPTMPGWEGQPAAAAERKLVPGIVAAKHLKAGITGVAHQTSWGWQPAMETAEQSIQESQADTNPQDPQGGDKMCKTAETTANQLKEAINRYSDAKVKLDAEISEANANRTHMVNQLHRLKKEVKDLHFDVTELEDAAKLRAQQR